MNAKERKQFVNSLCADFRTAKDGNSQDVAVWMNLARRYAAIGANMNFAYCVGRARTCRPVMHVVTDLGFPEQALVLTLVPVAVETEPA